MRLGNKEIPLGVWLSLTALALAMLACARQGVVSHSQEEDYSDTSDRFSETTESAESKSNEPQFGTTYVEEGDTLTSAVVRAMAVLYPDLDREDPYALNTFGDFAVVSEHFENGVTTCISYPSKDSFHFAGVFSTMTTIHPSDTVAAGYTDALTDMEDALQCPIQVEVSNLLVDIFHFGETEYELRWLTIYDPSGQVFGDFESITVGQLKINNGIGEPVHDTSVNAINVALPTDSQLYIILPSGQTLRADSIDSFMSQGHSFEEALSLTMGAQQ